MRILPIMLVLLTWVASLNAQVDMELILDQDQYLRDEPILVKVRITNRSGQTLKLGQDNGWISFGVDNAGRSPVERVGQPQVASPFELPSAHTATREFNIQPSFDISQTGRYSLSATMRIKQWEQDLSARPQSFEIVRGAKLWEQEVGVPTSSGPPEVRRFILLQANYRKRLKLYARVSNESDTFAFRVLPIGTVVSFGRPEAQVDEKSNLHVLFQTGARSFNYAVVSPAGVLTTRHSYDYTSTRPTLRLSEAGKIFVAGGIRKADSSDLPSATVIATPPSDKDVEPLRK